jgi:hypothetical protein
MIYICCIKNKQNIVVSVLVVRDDELDVGDDEVTSSEVVGGCRCATSLGKATCRVEILGG